MLQDLREVKLNCFKNRGGQRNEEVKKKREKKRKIKKEDG